MGTSADSANGDNMEDPTKIGSSMSAAATVAESPAAVSATVSNSTSSSPASTTRTGGGKLEMEPGDIEMKAASASASSSPAPKPKSAGETGAANQQQEEEKTKEKEKKKMSKREEEQEDMAWICAECKEAECSMILRDRNNDNAGEDGQDDIDAFIFCDGPCGRIFHFPCAGLQAKPDDEEEQWLCRDCSQNTHACAYCSEYGQDNVDVFACKQVYAENASCGLFFHEACLQSNGVEYTYDDTAATTKSEDKKLETDLDSDDDDDDDDEQNIPVFTCPAHHCWVCTQPDMIQLEKDEFEEQRKRVKAFGKRPPKKKQKKGKTIFQCKPASRLFRCLVCPRAYHVTCIPPAAKFHELAVLCHEHSETHKLPDLDLDTSIQMQVEDKIDQKLMRLHGLRQSRHKSNSRQSFWNKFGRGPNANPFFPGLRGDKLNTPETSLLNGMERFTEETIPKSTIVSESTGVNTPTASRHDDNMDLDDISNDMDVEDKNDVDYGEDANDSDQQLPHGFSQFMDGNIPFCIPIDMRDEVFSKPPMYTHIPSNKLLMSSIAKPKKIPGSDKGEHEKCSCSGRSCGAECFNRITMTECTGPHNCIIWEKTKDCGNRALSKRQFVKCRPQREPGKGWGLVTLKSIEKGQLVHEYVGEIIDEKEKERRLTEWNAEHPNDPNFYVMALGTGYYVDARVHGNQSRFINHSCDPNTRVATINVKGTLRNGIYATRDIKAGEFLCYDYHFDTKNGDMFICRCGSANCRGTMKEGRNLQGDANGNENKKRSDRWKEAKEKYDEDVKFLQETNSVVSLVGPLVPGADHENETVAMGPKRRETESRIFLFRNAELGADFVSRKSRLER